jgi:hypothetical protein
MPRYWVRRFAHVDGYYWNRYRSERGKEFGAIRYDSELFYNRDTNEYECPLGIVYPTRHPVFRIGAGLNAIRCPRLTDGSRFHGTEPDRGLIGYIVPKPSGESEIVFSDRSGNTYVNLACNWRIDYQDRVGSESFCLLFAHPEVNYDPDPVEVYLPTVWQRFHEPYILEATAPEAKLVTCSLCFEPYEVGPNSVLLIRPIQIDGVLYRFHRIGDIDILRGGVYTAQLLRRRLQPVPPVASVTYAPGDHPDWGKDVPTDSPRYFGMAEDVEEVPPDVAKVVYTAPLGAPVLFSPSISNGQIVALENRTLVNLEVAVFPGSVLVPPNTTGIFAVGHNGRAYLLALVPIVAGDSGI